MFGSNQDMHTDIAPLDGLCVKHLRSVGKQRGKSRTIPTERPPLVGEVIANFRGYHVVSVTDPCGLILCFLDRSRYFSIK
jgi:hypothetical protein